jgi:Xaa-Pro aminopeptidase
MVKTEAELDRMRQAAGVADRAQADAHGQVAEGMSEQELYRLIVDRALALGIDNVDMVQVAAASGAAPRTRRRANVRFRRGDIVKVAPTLAARS